MTRVGDHVAHPNTQLAQPCLATGDNRIALDELPASGMTDHHDLRQRGKYRAIGQATQDSVKYVER
jgi:hypothetical protein